MLSDSLLFVILILISEVLQVSPFPLHCASRYEKNVVKPMVESRDLILCWVVQINTLKSCSCFQNGTNDMANVADDEGEMSSSPKCCLGHNLVKDHILALSKEVNLEIHHTFGQFHDHFLLCHSETASGRRVPTSPISNYKSVHLQHLHRQHSRLRSTSQALFQLYERQVEQRLSQHREILWFTAEHVHKRHPRGAAPLTPKKPPKRNLVVLKVFASNEEPGLKNSHSVINFNDSVLHYSDSGLEDSSQHPFAVTHSAPNDIKDQKIEDKLSQSYTSLLSSSTHSSVNDSTHPHHLQAPRSKRSALVTFDDPAYLKQWHLFNSLGSRMDINVTGVWQHNYTGSGITVAVVDDGVEWRNADLKANYNRMGSWDLNDDDPDPSPSSTKQSNHHGTRCAGEIAAVANNKVCGVGVAYGAQISGLRVLDGTMTDSMEAEAFNKKMDINDIYSCSWGPDDDGRTVDGPHLMAVKAMKYGVDFGRKGFGNIFVVASGNGGEHHDNCNFDGYANSIYTVTIGAVDESGEMPYYAEECASMLGVTFSSGTNNKRDIVTTDWTEGKASGCTDSHTGTSAAAPLAAGMIALMLQARPCLTWRDVQYIIILTSQKVDVALAHWQENGAGLSHSHKHGFGLLNSWRLVNAARVWETVPWMTSFSYMEAGADKIIPKGSKTPLKMIHEITEADIRGLGLFTLENVQLTIWLTHPCRGKLGVQLISPAGTLSVLAAPRPLDNSTSGFSDWTFTTVRCWGEQPLGNWTILFIDNDEENFGQGRLTKLRLTLFGTPMTASEFAQRRQRVEAAMSGEFLSAGMSQACAPAQKYDSPYTPVSDRTLKIIILSGAFCLVMAIYETFEYIFCYDDEKKEAARNRVLARRARRLVDTSISSPDGDTSLPNGASLSLAFEDDDEGDDDVFDISETARLIRRDQNTGSEVIPMATFSYEEVRDPLPSNVVSSAGTVRDQSDQPDPN
ncbi:unnamed protein product [Lymnaea stagnalis]|uniref:P/Homo B domain-containing protein n=1 Tax=Lymnaea stagnalis TaxID=6523 RepID=A0AAV2IRB2_LYMST